MYESGKLKTKMIKYRLNYLDNKAYSYTNFTDENQFLIFNT